jgi:hypothetical protein
MAYGAVRLEAALLPLLRAAPGATLAVVDPTAGVEFKPCGGGRLAHGPVLTSPWAPNFNRGFRPERDHLLVAVSKGTLLGH